MKIEKMCSKQDLVSNLKRAAAYSKLAHLKQLAEYIQQEIELDNLKEGITIEHYEIKLSKEGYEIHKLTSSYDSEKNIWNTVKDEPVEQIKIEDVEKTC